MQYFSIWDLVSDSTIELLNQGTGNVYLESVRINTCKK